MESVASTYSAVEGALETRAVPVASGAPLAPPNVVSGAASSVLALVGLSPFISDNPLAPVPSPAMWAMLAWVRRQSQQTLIDETPTVSQTPAQSSQTVDSVVTGNTELSAPVTVTVADAAAVTPPAFVQVNAATPAPVQEAVTGDAAPMQAEVAAAADPGNTQGTATENLTATVPVATEELASVQKTAADPTSIQATATEDPAPVQEAVTGDAAPMQAEVAAAADPGNTQGTATENLTATVPVATEELASVQETAADPTSIQATATEDPASVQETAADPTSIQATATEDPPASVQETAADPTSIQATATEDPAPVQETVTGDAAPMQAEVAAADPGTTQGTATENPPATVPTATEDSASVQETAADPTSIQAPPPRPASVQETAADPTSIQATATEDPAPVQEIVTGDAAPMQAEVAAADPGTTQGTATENPPATLPTATEDPAPVQEIVTGGAAPMQAVVAAAADPSGLPAEFERTTIVSGLNQPTAFRFLPDGRILIAEKGGAIKVVQNGQLQTDPLITLIVLQTDTDEERGLLGIEPDPNFATNGYLYVSYTTAENYDRLSRITVVGDTADPASEVVLLESDQLGNIYHHGGEIHFGPDGKLLLGHGDEHLQPQLPRPYEHSREDPPAESNRWLCAGGQPVRRHTRRGRSDMGLRVAQPVPLHVHAERQALGGRCRRRVVGRARCRDGRWQLRVAAGRRNVRRLRVRQSDLHVSPYSAAGQRRVDHLRDGVHGFDFRTRLPKQGLHRRLHAPLDQGTHLRFQLR